MIQLIIDVIDVMKCLKAKYLVAMLSAHLMRVNVLKSISSSYVQNMIENYDFDVILG